MLRTLVVLAIDRCNFLHLIEAIVCCHTAETTLQFDKAFPVFTPLKFEPEVFIAKVMVCIEKWGFLLFIRGVLCIDSFEIFL